MTEAEAQAFLARAIVRYTENGETVAAFQEDGNTTSVVVGPGGQVHFLDPDDVVETLTVAEIAAIAGGG